MWIASLVALAVLVLGVTGTLAQFVASITNNNNNVLTAGPDSFGFSESNVVGGTVVPNNDSSPAPCASAGPGDTATCSVINKLGQDGAVATPIGPGNSRATTVRLENTAIPTGLSGNLSLTSGACSAVSSPAGANTAPGDLCGTVTVSISCDTTPIFTFSGTLTALATAAAPPTGLAVATAVGPGDFVDCTFTTTLPTTATAADLQNLEASQDLTWVFTSV